MNTILNTILNKIRNYIAFKKETEEKQSWWYETLKMSYLLASVVSVPVICHILNSFKLETLTIVFACFSVVYLIVILLSGEYYIRKKTNMHFQNILNNSILLEETLSTLKNKQNQKEIVFYLLEKSKSDIDIKQLSEKFFLLLEKEDYLNSLKVLEILLTKLDKLQNKENKENLSIEQQEKIENYLESLELKEKEINGTKNIRHIL